MRVVIVLLVAWCGYQFWAFGIVSDNYEKLYQAHNNLVDDVNRYANANARLLKFLVESNVEKGKES